MSCALVALDLRRRVDEPEKCEAILRVVEKLRAEELADRPCPDDDGPLQVNVEVSPGQARNCSENHEGCCRRHPEHEHQTDIHRVRIRRPDHDEDGRRAERCDSSEVDDFVGRRVVDEPQVALVQAGAVDGDEPDRNHAEEDDGKRRAITRGRTNDCDCETERHRDRDAVGRGQDRRDQLVRSRRSPVGRCSLMQRRAVL